jgi:CO dehydrogenase maturation factor
MDMEAGIEHMGRGTAEHVDCLLIVTEPNQTGLTTAERIIGLARDLGIPNHVLIGNKIAGDEDKEFIETFAKNEKPFYIPFSRGILRMSVSPGKPREMEPAVADSLSAIIAGIQDMDTRKR